MADNSKSTKGCCPCGACRKDDRISVSDQYESLWRCRDFELSHLWQRSVFLQALLLLCFTGYGSLLLNAFDKVCQVQPCQSFDWHGWLDAIAIALASLAMLVSIIWIMMAKASKLWYERYERAIDAFVAYSNHKYVDGELKNGKETWAGFQFYNLKDYEEPKSDKALETTKCGRYSPSRLNILIGQLSLIIWMLVASWHLTDWAIRAFFANCIGKMPLKICFFIGFFVLASLAVWIVSRFISRKRGFLAAGSSYG